jgi:hypothetical protein
MTQEDAAILCESASYEYRTKPPRFKHFRTNQASSELSKNCNLRTRRRFGHFTPLVDQSSSGA